jgi:PLP dependent protein
VRAVVGVPNVEMVQTVDSLKLARTLEKEVARFCQLSTAGAEDSRQQQDSDGGATRVLDVMLQVNTSGEASKSGLAPLVDGGDTDGEVAPLLALARAIRADMPHLRLRGLMTIGAPPAAAIAAREGRDIAEVEADMSAPSAQPPPDDFATLVRCRDALAAALGVTTADLLLSMGMSHDFEEALRAGADFVRVGSAIFGARQYPPK